jgi:hypothetical protein
MQAQADRLANQLKGLLGSLLVPGNVQRNSFCAAHG